MANTKKIPIKCKTALSVPLEQLVELQGELKTLGKDEYEKLRAAILTDGFSFAPHVWKSKGKFFLLDGHQRVRTVRKLVEEECYEPTELPVVVVEAKDLHQAKRKLLAAASTYGKGNPQGLAEFLADSGITAEELSSVTNIDGIDLPDFMDDFYQLGGETPSAPVGDIGEKMKSPSGSEQVRQLQLFFSAADYEEFVAKVEELMTQHGTENITDTVLEVVRAAHKAVRKAA